MTMTPVTRQPRITMRMSTIRIVAMSQIMRIDLERPRADPGVIDNALARSDVVLHGIKRGVVTRPASRSAHERHIPGSGDIDARTCHLHVT